MKVSEKAYAKINLTLDILGVRADGYHELESVMHTVGLYDTVTLECDRVAEDAFVLNCEGVSEDGAANTVRRAFEEFSARARRPAGRLEFTVEKRIPVAAGLAGGSADAATAIKLLDHAVGTGLSPGVLAEIGGAVGSDVPFCLAGGCHVVSGVGERLSSVVGLPKGVGIVLIKPPVGLGAGEIYRIYDGMGVLRPADTGGMIAALETGDIGRISAALGNHLEPAALSRAPVIDELKAALRESGAAGAALSGSGPTVFGLYGDMKAAERAGRELRGVFVDCEVIVTCPYLP